MEPPEQLVRDKLEVEVTEHLINWRSKPPYKLFSIPYYMENQYQADVPVWLLDCVDSSFLINAYKGYVSACVCVCLFERQTHTRRREGGDGRGQEGTGGGRRMKRRRDRTAGL